MPKWNKITDKEVALVRGLFFATQLSIEAMAPIVGRSFFTVFRVIKDSFSEDVRAARKRVCYRNSRLGQRNPMFGVCGGKHHGYHGGYLGKHGYLITTKPSWYSGRRNKENVFVHHIVACLALGLTEIPAGYQVHHCDSNRLNNNFGNLVVLTMSAHTKLHWALKRGEIEGATTISKESTLKWVEAHGGGVWHR